MSDEPLTRFEVTLEVENTTDPFGYHRWSMHLSAENFAHAERKTLATLAENGDNHSFIQKIELY